MRLLAWGLAEPEVPPGGCQRLALLRSLKIEIGEGITRFQFMWTPLQAPWDEHLTPNTRVHCLVGRTSVVRATGTGQQGSFPFPTAPF